MYSTAESVDALDMLFGAGNIDSEYEAYLADLTSYSIERLAKEPELLTAEASRIVQQMQELAYSNYKSFIQTSNCIGEISKEVTHVHSHLDQFSGHLPTLATRCEQFCTAAQSITSKRAIHRLAIQNHTQLLESIPLKLAYLSYADQRKWHPGLLNSVLLEVPQLMDTCVRNGFYEEALQLEGFAKKLGKTFAGVKVVEDVVREVDATTMRLQGQLVQQLRTQIQFPVSLSAIGYLRRYSELELRVTFLLCRDSWLQQSLSVIPDNNAYSYLSKLIDHSRTHLFDIITQYRAIFSDDSSSQDDPMKDGGLLYGWITEKIAQFVNTLKSFLPQIAEGASLARLLEQCMSYGASLGRVGVDFRGLLPPLFEKCIYGLFASSVTSSIHHFIEGIKSHRFSKHTSTASNDSKVTGDSLHPPTVLLEHPPLAVLTNGLLAALNELRQCAPLSLQAQITTRLRDALVAMVSAVQVIPTQVTLDSDQEQVFAHMCKVICEDFLPFVENCFDAVFHSTQPLVDIAPLVETLSRLYITSIPETEAEPEMAPSPPNELASESEKLESTDESEKRESTEAESGESETAATEQTDTNHVGEEHQREQHTENGS